jgi:hypothetical protein
MLIQHLEKQIDQFIERLKANYASYLPFRGKYLDALRLFLIGQMEHMRVVFDGFASPDGDAHKLIDFVIDHARGNLPIPWYMTPFESMFLEGVRRFLHANVGTVRGGIGQVL